MTRRRGCGRRDVADRRRPARRRAPRAAARAARRADVDRRAPRIAAEATDGWLYLVTVTGTTGARAELAPSLAPLAERARAVTDGAALRRLRHLDAASTRAPPASSSTGSPSARARSRRPRTGPRRCRASSPRCARRSTGVARLSSATRRRRRRLRRVDRARARAARLGRHARRAVHAGHRALGVGRRHAPAARRRTATSSGTRELAWRARTLWLELQERHGHAHLGAGRASRGSHSAPTASRQRSRETLAAARHSRASGSRRTTRSASTRRSRVDDLHAVLCEPDAGVLHARRATQLLVEDARQLGRDAAARRGSTPADAPDADVVVWACGAWLPALFPTHAR